jgi:hypothetical protein
MHICRPLPAFGTGSCSSALNFRHRLRRESRAIGLVCNLLAYNYRSAFRSGSTCILPGKVCKRT